MTAKRRKPIRGRWRIVETDLWAKDYLDMDGPAHIVFQANGTGEFAARQGDSAVPLLPRRRFLHLGGFDELTRSRRRFSDITDDGTLEGEIAFLDGDEAQFKAKRNEFFSSLLERVLAGWNRRMPRRGALRARLTQRSPTP